MDNKFFQYIMAGIFAGICGVFSFCLIYYLFGFIIILINKWLDNNMGVVE
jgi:hypothetical protein